MEVLTEVDRDLIAALRGRDEFFWLDLASPSDADLDALGDLLGLHELALEDTREFGRRPKLDRDQWGPATEAILDLPGLTHGSRPYLRDIGDHLAQVTGELYRQADDLGALTSTYFNANANRLNRTATRLTVLATFFLIWTLVTSFFGQNFGWLVDHIDSLEAFLIYDGVGLVIPTIAAAGYFWRRRRDWL